MNAYPDTTNEAGNEITEGATKDVVTENPSRQTPLVSKTPTIYSTQFFRESVITIPHPERRVVAEVIDKLKNLSEPRHQLNTIITEKQIKNIKI